MKRKDKLANKKQKKQIRDKKISKNKKINEKDNRKRE